MELLKKVFLSLLLKCQALIISQNSLTKERVYLLLSMSVGIIIFSYYFDFSIVRPDNNAWILRDSGDSLSAYLGSYAFRADGWHFPITKTTLIDYPEGVSIFYLDANPLLSIFFKIFRFAFPPEYQFFGAWFLICWLLQAVFAFLIVKRLTNNDVVSLLSTFLFCLLPHGEFI